MAEVLITLGIIGVVAALTLPTLIAKFQNQVYVNKLKKVVSTLENGIKQAAVDEGTDVGDSDFFTIFNVYECLSPGLCDERGEQFRKYFKVLSINKEKRGIKSSKSGNPYQNGIIYFVDGSSINLDNMTFSLIYIDINGDSKPNVYGRDFFQIKMDKNGILHDIDDCDTLYDYFRTYKNSNYPDYQYALYLADNNSCGKCKTILENNPNYDGCYFYRIRSEGWQMNY